MHLLISVMLAKKYQKCIFFPYYIYIKDAVRIKGEQLEKEVGKGVFYHRLALQVQKMQDNCDALVLINHILHLYKKTSRNCNYIFLKKSEEI